MSSNPLAQIIGTLVVGAFVFWVPVVTVAVAVIGQIIAGIGIGLSHPISGVVAFSQTGKGGVGKTSANLQLRLLVIKKQYDPTNFFRQNHNIDPLI